MCHKDPYKIWTRHRPTLSHLWIWGCPAYVKYLHIDKLGPQSDKYMFIGCPKESKDYYFNHVEEQKVFINLKAIFLEKKFLGEETIDSKIELDEVQ